MFTYFADYFWVSRGEKFVIINSTHLFFYLRHLISHEKKTNKYVYMIILPGEPSKRNIRIMTFLQTLWTSYETIVDTFQIEENLYLI